MIKNWKMCSFLGSFPATHHVRLLRTSYVFEGSFESAVFRQFGSKLGGFEGEWGYTFSSKNGTFGMWRDSSRNEVVNFRAGVRRWGKKQLPIIALCYGLSKPIKQIGLVFTSHLTQFSKQIFISVQYWQKTWFIIKRLQIYHRAED